MATTSFSNWDFRNQRIQQEVTGGQFLSAETTLIAAGPPSLDNPTAQNGGGGGGTVDGAGEAYPIGLLESFGLQQNRQLQRIFEIGSSRSYFIPGRNIGSMSLGRTMYYGPNLLKALYAYYSDTTMEINTAEAGSMITGADGREYPNPKAAMLPASTQSLHKLGRRPGYDHFFVDLASDMFAQPTGMAVYFKDYDGLSVGAFYLNECYVQGHQLNISSGSVLIMEGAQMQYDTMTPIQMIA
jgi:hypothetical protein